MKEIGSNFWLDKNFEYSDEAIKLDMSYQDLVFMSTGRSAISLILKNLNLENKQKKVLLPAFTCSTVIGPFLDADYNISFYDIDKNLESNLESFIDEVKNFNPSVILIHNYFGFDTTSEIKKEIEINKNKGIIIIEDLTQSLYSNIDRHNANYYISSLRKWGPLPDGAFALSNDNNFNYMPVGEDSNLIQKKLEAFHLKYLYMEHDIGNKEQFMNLMSDAEKLLNSQEKFYKMGEISKKVQSNIDKTRISVKRNNNYKILLEGISKNSKLLQPIFDDISENITPLYFPIYVKDRRSLQSFLAKNNIYAPIIWPKPNSYKDTKTEAEWIYDHILSIPCDQRYDNEDMYKIIETIETYEKIVCKAGEI